MIPIKTVLMQRLVAGLPPELGEKGFRMKSRFPYLFVLGKRAKNNLMILSCSPLLPMIGFRRKEGFSVPGSRELAIGGRGLRRG